MADGLVGIAIVFRANWRGREYLRQILAPPTAAPTENNKALLCTIIHNSTYNTCTAQGHTIVNSNTTHMYSTGPYSSKLKLIGFITAPEIREVDSNLTPRTREKNSTSGREVTLILFLKSSTLGRQQFVAHEKTTQNNDKHLACLDYLINQPK